MRYHKSMKALVIADRAPDIDIAATCREQAVDIVITLGDLECADLLGLTRVTHIPKIGVYGIHRSGTYMEELEILNVHMVTREYGGRTFGGFQGCVRYKENPDTIMCTQQEASAMQAQFSPVDIMVCHCSPRGINDEEELAHQGFDGLRAYIDRTPPKVLLHRHTYPTEQTVVREHGPTRIEHVHKWRIVEWCCQR